MRSSQDPIRFDAFELDPLQGLARGADEVHLTPKSLQVLILLTQRAGQIVTKEELFREVWSETSVSDSALATCIQELRHALGDNARAPQFIETVHRRGYRFVAKLSGPQPSDVLSTPAFRLLWSGPEISLMPGKNLLGRCRECVAWIDDASISRRHALIEISAGQASIRDLGSKNGTFVHGRRIDRAATLADGDPITIGRVPMIFRVFRDGGPTTSIESASL